MVLSINYLCCLTYTILFLRYKLVCIFFYFSTQKLCIGLLSWRWHMHVTYAFHEGLHPLGRSMKSLIPFAWSRSILRPNSSQRDLESIFSPSTYMIATDPWRKICIKKFLFVAIWELGHIMMMNLKNGSYYRGLFLSSLHVLECSFHMGSSGSWQMWAWHVTTWRNKCIILYQNREPSTTIQKLMQNSKCSKCCNHLSCLGPIPRRSIKIKS